MGLGIQNDIQAAAYLRENGYGHHPVPSRTLLYIILHSEKGGSCGGVNDYRVVEAQMMLDILREATEHDLDAIKVAKEKLEHAIELRNITSEGKSKGGIKAGLSGGKNDPRVAKAQAKVDKLLDATVVDKDAIEAAMKKLEYAIELRNITSEAKSKAGSKGGSCGGDKDHRVAKAQEEVDKLLDASVMDEDAINAPMERLNYAIELRNITSEGKSRGVRGIDTSHPLPVVEGDGTNCVIS